MNLSLKEIAEMAGKAALQAVQPARLIADNIAREGDELIISGSRLDLEELDKIRLISFGKAGEKLAESLLPLVEDRLEEAVITGVYEYREEKSLTFFPAAHPLPDRWSLLAGKKAYELALKSGQKDLLLVMISGGGSAHLCLPEEGITLEEKRIVTDLLLKAGADIKELNTVRKHLSRIKGGRLARAAWPARVFNLIVSDVVGNDLESIASGPTWYDSTTYDQAWGVLEKYDLLTEVPEAICRVLEEGRLGKREETVKKGDRVLERVSSVVIGDNLKAIYAAKEAVRRRGLEAVVLTSEDSGEAKEVARNYLERFLEFARKA
mgnify:CR=1 FL=1